MKATYNVVFAGKTGTGKSSLINYLYGINVRETVLVNQLLNGDFIQLSMKLTV
ncbi:MAG: hypothetical protein HQK77_20685 [Desulfobacterales bacterium]|nr:hypothetical protein [Desulfobacterales bacterium]